MREESHVPASECDPSAQDTADIDSPRAGVFLEEKIFNPGSGRILREHELVAAKEARV